MKKRQYSLIVCGATFDQFHKGHQAFLAYALTLSDKVLLGLTSDTYVAKEKQVGSIQSYAEREKRVLSYLKETGSSERVAILSIDTGDIPEAWAALPIEAILVTNDSLKGAEAINKTRESKGERPLRIIAFPLVLAEDKKPISATRIRKGEISSEGVVFIKPEWLTKALLLPVSLRSRLQKPFGEIIDAKTAAFSSSIVWQKTISVGDVTTSLLHARGFTPRLAIVDFIVERKKTFYALSELGFSGKEQVVAVKNPAGQISPVLFQALQAFFTNETESKDTVLLIDGEEDLAVLPAILLCPLGWFIFYGQPGVGTVQLSITEERKVEVHTLLDKFTIR